MRAPSRFRRLIRRREQARWSVWRDPNGGKTVTACGKRPAPGARLRVLFGLILAACGAWGGAADRPLVFVGLPPQRWLVRQLAGDRLQVGLLLPAGQNPHTFEPTVQQARALSNAGLYLMMGLPFERQIVQRVQGVNRGLTVCEVTAGIRFREAAPRAGHAHADADGCDEGADPHVWLTAANMMIIASNTAAALAACDPPGRTQVEARLAGVIAGCAQLDRELQAELAPARGRTLLAYHPSWGYFAAAYGLRQVVIEAEGRPPAARQLAALIDAAQREQVRCVFTEPPYDPRPAETLARQIGARVVCIDSLAEDWPAMMRDVAAKVRASVAAPAGGLSSGGGVPLPTPGEAAP